MYILYIMIIKASGEGYFITDTVGVITSLIHAKFKTQPQGLDFEFGGANGI